MTEKQFLLSLFISLFSCSFLSAQNSYVNPVLGGDYPDPTIMREGNDYYMTHSAFDYQPGLTVFHSTDMVHWEPISYALKVYLGSVWAPDISKYKDKYYIYFTVALPHGRKNYVTYASSPYGPWSDPVDLKIGNIDPCHIVGEDGARWMFMSGGKRVKLAADGLSIIPGTEEVVYKGWEYPKSWITEGFALEGPKLKKIGDYYYYLSAEGGTAGPPTSHMVVVARSKSINGPWINSPYNPLIHTWNKSERWWSKGHGSLIDTPDGKWYIVYHSYENNYTNLGRQTLMEPVRLTADGWFKRFENINIEKAIPAPFKLTKSLSSKSNLNKFRVGFEWKFYKSFEADRISINENVLTLKAKGTDAGSSSPMLFVAGEHKYEIEAEIKLEGEASAGIVLYYNSQFFMGTGFNRVNRFRYRKGEARNCGKNPAGTDHIWLRIRNDENIVTGAYSYDGKNWQDETWGMDISGYNHNTLYEFQSVLPGIFSFGNGKAHFINLKYKSLK